MWNSREGSGLINFFLRVTRKTRDLARNAQTASAVSDYPATFTEKNLFLFKGYSLAPFALLHSHGKQRKVAHRISINSVNISVC